MSLRWSGRNACNKFGIRRWRSRQWRRCMKPGTHGLNQALSWRRWRRCFARAWKTSSKHLKVVVRDKAGLFLQWTRVRLRCRRASLVVPWPTACWTIGWSSLYILIMVKRDKLFCPRIPIDDSIRVTSNLGCSVL